MIVRGYDEKDLGRMISIWNEVVADGIAFPQEECLTEETGRAFFASQSHCGVAEDEGNIVGMYILHPNNVGRCGHICNASYAVDSRIRGKGIGEALVRDCMQMGAELGFRILQFNAVVKSNTAAMHLYKKLGFTQLGVIPGGFRMPDGKYADIVPHFCELAHGMNVRKATLNDLPQIEKLFSDARRFMASQGNPDQWEEGYPHCVLGKDLEKEQLYVCQQNGHIYAAFVMALGEEPAYQVIEGEWKNHKPYVTLHRIASTGEKSGMMDIIAHWAFQQHGNVRGDTHEKNLPMRRAFERNGFEYCGTIWVEDGTPRMAYHKTK